MKKKKERKNEKKGKEAITGKRRRKGTSDRTNRRAWTRKKKIKC